jgi:hypothetical protein
MSCEPIFWIGPHRRARIGGASFFNFWKRIFVIQPDSFQDQSVA